ncbi:hypothetical protein SCHPADRAFT_906379 [Schizopora paradoxa]|uniref:Uncharacterized protein n=1 Tax=Schizopora paradoxa TaxID=27342 RepID=A0A0H2RHL5_9AGAM|nr:hypothetical protein SCHPADRAFT_906379 [Schizopora paradoxa]
MRQSASSKFLLRQSAFTRMSITPFQAVLLQTRVLSSSHSFILRAASACRLFHFTISRKREYPFFPPFLVSPATQFNSIPRR